MYFGVGNLHSGIAMCSLASGILHYGVVMCILAEGIVHSGLRRVGGPNPIPIFNVIWGFGFLFFHNPIGIGFPPLQGWDRGLNEGMYGFTGVRLR